ncbi:unnamed protein product, partial [Coregonus sp. 'balchen']
MKQRDSTLAACCNGIPTEKGIQERRRGGEEEGDGWGEKGQGCQRRAGGREGVKEKEGSMKSEGDLRRSLTISQTHLKKEPKETRTDLSPRWDAEDFLDSFLSTVMGLERGNKAESLLNYVRAEFNGIMLGDSQKLDAAVDQGVDYNFTCSFECSDAGHTLDDMAHKPVILTVIEILPKEKKQKEEKTAVIGQAIVDLIPLLHGQVSFSSTLSESNLLKVTVETAYSVPEVWNPVSGSGPPCSYKEQVLLFSNGLLKVGGEIEPMGRPRKWPLGPLLASGAQFIPGVSIEAEPIEMEDGDLTSIEDRDFRNEAETNKKRVSWDTERRCFLDADGAACLTRRIAESRLWPVEVMRSPQVGATKGGKAGKDKGGEDETQLSFHGVAYVDMAPLLYPGARRIRGAYRLYPFYDSDLLVKGRGRALSSVGSCKAAPSKMFDGGHKGGKDTKESPKRPGTQGKSAPVGTDSVTLVEPEQQQQVNIEGQMYADSRTYIIIEIAFEKSLVPKRSPEELAKRVMELIPARAPLPRRPAGAERAVQEYQAQIASVAGQYSLVMFLLPCHGQYSVVRIVREKMLRTEAFSDPEQLQAFLSQLYVFLTLSVDAQETQPRPLQLTRDRSDPAHWFDYGVFYMLTADYQKAEECFHYAVSMEQTHLPSLLMCGILAEMGGRLEEAETFFEGATCLFNEGQENSIQTEMAFLEATKQLRAALVVTPPCRVETGVEPPALGEEEQEVASCESLTIKPDVEGDTEASVVTGSQSCQGSKPGEGYKGGAEAEPSAMRHLATPTRLNTTIYMETVQFLLQNNALQDPDVWALFGHIHHMTGEFGKAQECYERTLDFVTDATDTHPIYLRLGSIYLQEGEFQRAKMTYLRACKSTPSCLTWLGLGIACYRTGRRLEAEQSYKYALKLNLQKEAVLCEIKALQDHVGFGNP